jgi:hypothetical protein
MIGDLREKSISCPYCGELIGLLIDTSVSPQAYIEDCSVCCRPIEVHVVVEDDQCFVEARAGRFSCRISPLPQTPVQSALFTKCPIR